MIEYLPHLEIALKSIPTSIATAPERIGEITRMGDGYLRTLLVVGATAVIRSARTKATPRAAWIRSLLAKKPWIALPADVPAFEAYYDSKKLWPAESLERRKAVFG